MRWRYPSSFLFVENKLVGKIDIKVTTKISSIEFLRNHLAEPSGEEEKYSISGWRISNDRAMINIDRDTRVSSDKVA